MAKGARKKAKAKTDPLRWHFPVLDHGETEGYNDPLLQYFEGDYGKYVAREVIQNSIDARNNQEVPVSVKFEKIMMAPKDVPGLAELSKRLEACYEKAKEKKKPKAELHFKKALEVIRERNIAVLRASDFNTSGLTGQDDDEQGRWHRLVKAVGENEMTGVGGGSFGIGKGAPFAASLLRAVYYSTLNEQGEHIFQGKTRILSHVWRGKDFRGVGFFGVDGYNSVRDPQTIPHNFLRSEQGTDVTIIGYNSGDDWMADLAKSVLDNFWMAVHVGDLEVSIAEGESQISINKGTLHEQLERFSPDEGLIYYRTVISPTKLSQQSLPLLGKCYLYIKQDETFPKNIALMRKPKMVVRKRSFKFQDPYAGVFICDDDKGNILLRGLEPPEHNDWDEKRDKENGKAAWDEVGGWIRDTLKEMATEEGGDPENIPGLDEFLPYDEESERLSESKSKSRKSGEATRDETPSEVGAEREEIEDEIEDYIRKPSSRQNEGGAGPGLARTAHGSGGQGQGGAGGGNTPDSGMSRINTSAVNFRIIYGGNKDGRSEYCLILDPLGDQEGALGIVAVGEDAAVYPVALSSAVPWDGKKQKYSTRGSFITDLKLKQGEKLKIRIGLRSNAKYALGIENYEG